MNPALLPDAVRSGPPRTTLQSDLALNAWALVAVGVAFVTRDLLRRHADWEPLVRAALALAPLIPSWLYLRRLARWMRGLDEMQRRIQGEAALFATVGTLLVATGLSLLASAGNLLPARLAHGLGWEGTFACAIGLYIAGNVISNRRYR